MDLKSLQELRNKFLKKDKKEQEFYQKLRVCDSHPILSVLTGRISGGRSYKQARKADLWVVTDASVLDDFIQLWDTSKDLAVHSDHKRIVYFPIVDRKTPKNKKILDIVLNLMYTYLSDGKWVHVSCQGGHGRTGLVISCFIAKYCKDIADPVKYIREKYCTKAVETFDQHALVHQYAGLPVPDDKEYKPVYTTYPPDDAYWSSYTPKGNLDRVQDKEFSGFGLFGYESYMREDVRKLCAKKGGGGFEDVEYYP